MNNEHLSLSLSLSLPLPLLSINGPFDERRDKGFDKRRLQTATAVAAIFEAISYLEFCGVQRIN